jgi:hypothetical protein
LSKASESAAAQTAAPPVVASLAVPFRIRVGLALGCVAAFVAAGCGEPEPPPKAVPSVPPAPAFPFTDVTAASGIDFVHDSGAEGRRHYVETMAPGLALFDADLDGDLDLYVVDGGPLPGGRPRAPRGNRLFLNRGDGTFEDASDGSGAADAGYGMGVAIGDVDGDGDPDLYVLNYGPNALYENLGGGRFARRAAGVEDPSWSVSGVFFDYDGDRDLDLYVANYLEYDVETERPCHAGTLEIYCSPEQFPPAADRLYRNDGGWRFSDVSRAAGVATDTRGMGIVAGDLDGDGDQDLYVTNDRSPNLLYLNDGGPLREVAVESGVGYGATGMAEGGMGVVTGDLTGDGRPAIFLTNFQKEPNRLFVAGGDGFFDDRSNASGLGMASRPVIGWGIAAADVEGDGDLDLAVANGHVFDNAAEFIPGSDFAIPDHLYRNDGSGRFELELFPGEPQSSRGLASGDLDGDGDPDLAITACGGRLRLWRNDADRPERFLLLRLAGRPPSTDAYGARVAARAGGREIRREVTSGGSYASQGDRRVTIGLGEAAAAERLAVRWPDGTVEEVAGEAGGQELVWRQGEGIVERRRLAPGPR